ncbi:hypothetical protein CYMTET_15181 [Cymbomonas tetramitiformis]|uniref:Uncharacterized protein n=1 Tax=Cymbomonas tetramitiformis TaxID=36881 RepID=A0AAE0GEH9_9CHLO|nr:hypothetical protein CYMTET_15181 [Cymbomonas tetramitiformis]
MNVATFFIFTSLIFFMTWRDALCCTSVGCPQTKALSQVCSALATGDATYVQGVLSGSDRSGVAWRRLRGVLEFLTEYAERPGCAECVVRASGVKWAYYVLREGGHRRLNAVALKLLRLLDGTSEGRRAIRGRSRKRMAPCARPDRCPHLVYDLLPLSQAMASGAEGGMQLLSAQLQCMRERMTSGNGASSSGGPSPRSLRNLGTAHRGGPRSRGRAEIVALHCVSPANAAMLLKQLQANMHLRRELEERIEAELRRPGCCEAPAGANSQEARASPLEIDGAAGVAVHSHDARKGLRGQLRLVATKPWAKHAVIGPYSRARLPLPGAATLPCRCACLVAALLVTP